MPKFGNHSAADVWEETPRTLTGVSVEEIVDLPELDSGYAGCAPVSAAMIGGFGSWVELSADVGVGKRLIGIVVAPLWSGITGFKVEIEAGEGGSGSEAAITRVPFGGQVLTFGATLSMYIPVYRSLSDNARLSFRVRDGSMTAFTYRANAVIA